MRFTRCVQTNYEGRVKIEQYSQQTIASRMFLSASTDGTHVDVSCSASPSRQMGCRRRKISRPCQCRLLILPATEALVSAT